VIADDVNIMLIRFWIYRYYSNKLATVCVCVCVCVCVRARARVCVCVQVGFFNGKIVVSKLPRVVGNIVWQHCVIL